MELKDPVTKAPLVGKKYSQRLKRLEIETISDLLHHYPRDYNDYSQIKKISFLNANDAATVQGKVQSIQNRKTRKGLIITKAVVADDTGRIEAVWFNQPFLKQNINEGDTLNLSGEITGGNFGLNFKNPEYEVLKGESSVHTGRLVPVYPETKGVSSKWLRAVLTRVIENENLKIEDFLPQKIQKNHGLISLQKALKQIHFPDSRESMQKARRRLSFDELFKVQIRTFRKRKSWRERGDSLNLKPNDHEKEITELIESLPFKLTNAQERVLDEILKDLGSETPMNRLLEGDVGSGKTVVAAVGMYLAHLEGKLSLLMAPTGVLAKQHFNTVKQMLEPLGVEIELHTGANTAHQHEDTSVFIGTHALLYDKIEFDEAALIVIDEQHRFGVKQRAKLLKKASATKVPHVISMTATPIPRTMALTAYGDLDISVIDELPPGRKPVKTWVVPEPKRKNGEEWIREQIEKNGAQAFVICPLIEESDKLQVKAAVDEYERLKEEVFPDLEVELLHGGMGSDQKDEIIKKFSQGKADILVSTSVVEVGVDIPNATIMVIEGAERFGLASLHQLRGRVGRSEKESYCFLFTDAKSEKALKRLKAMERINDGFELAELDLQTRGPGEIYGVKQHGLPNLKIASFADAKLIKETRSAAEKLLEEDPELKNHPEIKKLIKVEKEIAPN